MNPGVNLERGDASSAGIAALQGQVLAPSSGLGRSAIPPLSGDKRTSGQLNRGQSRSSVRDGRLRRKYSTPLSRRCCGVPHAWTDESPCSGEFVGVWRLSCQVRLYCLSLNASATKRQPKKIAYQAIIQTSANAPVPGCANRT